MYFDKYHNETPDVLLSELPEGAEFKLDLASSKSYRVIDSVNGEVYDVNTGLVRRFPPYWWTYIFY